MVRDILKSAAYVTLDDDAIRRALDEDPYNQLKALSDQAKDSGLPVVIDEVQRLPELTFALKRIVDQDNRRGHAIPGLMRYELFNADTTRARGVLEGND